MHATLPRAAALEHANGHAGPNPDRHKDGAARSAPHARTTDGAKVDDVFIWQRHLGSPAGQRGHSPQRHMTAEQHGQSPLQHSVAEERGPNSQRHIAAGADAPTPTDEGNTLGKPRLRSGSSDTGGGPTSELGFNRGPSDTGGGPTSDRRSDSNLLLPTAAGGQQVNPVSRLSLPVLRAQTAVESGSVNGCVNALDEPEYSVALTYFGARVNPRCPLTV